jgi:hypothetical protein
VNHQREKLERCACQDGQLPANRTKESPIEVGCVAQFQIPRVHATRRVLEHESMGQPVQLNSSHAAICSTV